jgi:hypothetical protein
MRSSIIVLVCTLLTAISVSAQRIPANLKKAFAAAYPAATSAKWEKEKGNFEVGFSLNGQKMSLLYLPDGKVAETETSISVEALPAKAKAYAAARGKITEAAKIILANGTVRYEAEVKKQDLFFDEAGNYISKD